VSGWIIEVKLSTFNNEISDFDNVIKDKEFKKCIKQLGFFNNTTLEVSDVEKA
jgi:hypothetical protein